MAEICLECLAKLCNEKPRKRKCVLSKELHLCTICGEQKKVVVRGKGIVFAIKRKMAARRLRKIQAKIF